MLLMTKTLSSPARPSRVSVPISPQALDAFERLAKAGNMSTGKAIASWLDDTIEAAEFMATTLEKARAAPKVVMAEIHAYALGLADETGDLLKRVREKGRAPATRATGLQPGAGGGGAEAPPSCNTGGKVPKVKGPQRGGKSS